MVQTLWVSLRDWIDPAQLAFVAVNLSVTALICRYLVARECMTYQKEYYQKHREKKLLYARLWRAKNRERDSTRSAIWRKANPERFMLNQTKHRARKRQLDFDLSLADIIIPDFCPILGVEFAKQSSGRGENKYRPTIDRIDNTKGYVKGNVQVISGLANAMKNSATPEELKKFAEWVLR